MALDRPLRNMEPSGNLRIRQALAQRHEYFEFFVGDARINQAIRHHPAMIAPT